jgi:hypothetical protein
MAEHLGGMRDELSKHGTLLQVSPIEHPTGSGLPALAIEPVISGRSQSNRPSSQLHDSEEMMMQSIAGSETRALISYLDEQRNHAIRTLDGLDEVSLRRPILPSGWNCLGLIHHLALDVERFWFRAVIAGEQSVIDGLATTPNAWEVSPHVPATTVLDLYRREIVLANAIIASTRPESAPAWWPGDLFGEWRQHTLREAVLHVMTETACHAGHLDVARELIDGKLWLVLTD